MAKSPKGKDKQQESSYSVSTYSVPETIVFSNPYMPSETERIEEETPPQPNLFPQASAPPLPPYQPPQQQLLPQPHPPQQPPPQQQQRQQPPPQQQPHHEPAVRFVLVHDRPVLVPSNRSEISLEEYQRRKKQARNMLLWNIILPGV